MIFRMDYQLWCSYFNRNLSKHLARSTVRKRLEDISWIHIRHSMLFWILSSYLRKYISEYLWDSCQLLWLFVAVFARGLEPVSLELMHSTKTKCHFLVEFWCDISHTCGWAVTGMLKERGCTGTHGEQHQEGLSQVLMGLWRGYQEPWPSLFPEPFLFPQT